jgi:SAM-dependent methyltransferase
MLPLQDPPADHPRPCLHSRYPYNQVLALVDERQPGDALDVGAGTGALAAELLRRNWRLWACDIAPEQMLVPEVQVLKSNLNCDPLPFADESFDLVTCSEVIEHVENPHALVREFRRVLRPGGRAILTTPNVLNVESRVKALCAGVSSHHRNLGDQLGRVTPGQPLGHVNVIPLPVAVWLGQAYGMPLEAVAADYVPRGMRFYVALAWAIRLFTRLSPPRSRSRYHVDLANSQPVLLGYRLVLCMLKSDDTPAVRIIPARRHWGQIS